jgi:SAM-dependent methyltransferase
VLAQRYERLFDACLQYRSHEQFRHDIAGLLPNDELALPINPYQVQHQPAADGADGPQATLIDDLINGGSLNQDASRLAVLGAYKLLLNIDELDPVRDQIKNCGYALARLLQPVCAARDTSSEPRQHHLPCKATTQADLESPWFAYWCKQLNIAPIYHRKLWEFAYVLQVLFDHGQLRPGASGIGFGCGAEPLASWFAAQQINALISDLPVAEVIGRGWMETGQHASVVDMAWCEDLVSRKLFDRHVRHRFIDMNAIPALDESFDFCWSICALEHVGSIAQAVAFIENSLSVLRPGGVAVHTTEFNYLSQTETIEQGPTVLFLRRHFEELAAALQAKGHRISGMDFDVGSKPMDQFIDLPPYGPGRGYYALDCRTDHEQAGHLKLSVERYPCTCFGLAIQKSA